MKTNDNAVERILGALRDVPPPVGMEGRILIALEAAQEKRTTPTQGWLGVFTPQRLRWSGAVAAALVVAAAWYGSAHHDGTAVQHTERVAAPVRATEAAATPGEVAIAGLPTHISARRATSVATAQTAESAEGESDSAIVSHPAPPLPTTAQERLLLEYARRANPGDLAQVSNDRRSEEQRREAAEFHAFFQPPPSVTGESE